MTEIATEITFTPPAFCECGFAPVTRNNPQQVIAPEHQWLAFIPPGGISPVCFFVCPACSRVYGNMNVLQNIKLLQDLQERRIVLAQKAEPKVNMRVFTGHGQSN